MNVADVLYFILRYYDVFQSLCKYKAHIFYAHSMRNHKRRERICRLELFKMLEKRHSIYVMFKLYAFVFLHSVHKDNFALFFLYLDNSPYRHQYSHFLIKYCTFLIKYLSLTNHWFSCLWWNNRLLFIIFSFLQTFNNNFLIIFLNL